MNASCEGITQRSFIRSPELGGKLPALYRVTRCDSRRDLVILAMHPSIGRSGNALSSQSTAKWRKVSQGDDGERLSVLQSKTLSLTPIFCSTVATRVITRVARRIVCGFENS